MDCEGLREKPRKGFPSSRNGTCKGPEHKRLGWRRGVEGGCKGEEAALSRGGSQ